MHNSVEDRLAALLSRLLGERISKESDARMDAVPAWDSIKHVEIIVTAEEAFGVSFSPEDIPRLTSQSLLAAELRRLSSPGRGE